jgi:hypothetical protein
MKDLLDAARDGDLATIMRLHAEGVDVSERDMDGRTAIMLAAGNGRAKVVRFLQAAGASIFERDDHGCSALNLAALYGRLSLLRYFLQETGASINDVTLGGSTVWELLEPEGADPVALASLLKVMVMLDDAPPAFVTNLSPAHAELTTCGRHFRAQLPSYLEQQRASVVEYCPLPVVLQSIVAEYAVTTPEDMWMDGLPIQGPQRKRPRASDGRS